jgi:hypothetical protein
MAVKFTKPEINVREKLAELDKPSGIAGEAMLRAETPQEQFNLIGAGRRNMIINGDMRIAQRGTSETGLITSTRAGPDRFRLDLTTNQSGTHTLSQTTDAPSNFKYSWKVQCTTAQASPNQMRCSYPVEGYDVAHLGYGTTEAKPLTLSFWVKSNVVGTYGLSIETAVAYRYFSTNYTIDSPNVWEYKTIYIAGDKVSGLNGNNTLGLYFSWWLTSNSSLKVSPVADNWVTQSSYNNIVGTDTNVNMASSTANSWQITGVQLETGKVATPFEHRSYGEELALCQRYFERLEDLTSTDSNGNTSTETLIGLGYCYTTTRVMGHVTWKATKRTNPTCTVSPVTDIQCLSTAGLWISATAVDVRANKNSARLDITTGSAMQAAGQACEVRFNTSSPVGYIYIDAEL